MKYYTHNQLPVDIDMTSLVGQVNVSYDELVSAFGKPLPGDGYKTDAEWRVRFSDGSVATIYNWKNGPAYLGVEPEYVRLIRTWNVGGHNSAALQNINDVLLTDLTGSATRLPLP